MWPEEFPNVVVDGLLEHVIPGFRGGGGSRTGSLFVHFVMFGFYTWEMKDLEGYVETVTNFMRSVISVKTRSSPFCSSESWGRKQRSQFQKARRGNTATDVIVWEFELKFVVKARILQVIKTVTASRKRYLETAILHNKEISAVALRLRGPFFIGWRS